MEVTWQRRLKELDGRSRDLFVLQVAENGDLRRL